MEGRIVSINLSKRKGVSKRPLKEGYLKAGCGLVGDAHSFSSRQLSLLDYEEISKFLREFPSSKVKPGSFAENITVEGLDFKRLSVGKELKLGRHSIIRITEIGKSCRKKCVIMKTVGRCIMPKRGVFAEVIRSGKIRKGDVIKIV